MLWMSWCAMIVSGFVAAFLGLLIWKHKEPPTGAFIAFAIFAGLPILVFSLPQIAPILGGYSVETPQGRYRLSLSQVAAKAEAAETAANNAKKESDHVVAALTQSVASVPPVQKQSRMTRTEGESPGACRPYIYSGTGYEPSPGLLIVGLGKLNWFPVVASIYSEPDAVESANRLASKETTYPLEVHKAADPRGKPVWAVTLGSGLSQDDAVARVCYAQNSGIYDKGSYAWASDKWSANLRSN